MREALETYSGDMATRYAALKLAGLEEAPCQFAVFADAATETGHRLGRRTMPEMAEYSVVTAVSLMWLAARAEGIGMGWVSILDPARINGILDVPARVALHRLFLPRLSRERKRPAGAGARRMGTAQRRAVLRAAAVVGRPEVRNRTVSARNGHTQIAFERASVVHAPNALVQGDACPIDPLPRCEKLVG